MIDARGVIVAVDGDYAIVRMEQSGCGRCNESGGCGGNTLARMFCGAPRSFRVLNPGKLAIAASVVVAVDENALRRSVLLCYGLPLLALFVGAISGSAISGENGAIIGAMCGLLLSWLVLRYAHLHRALDPRSQPFIRS